MTDSLIIKLLHITLKLNLKRAVCANVLVVDDVC